MKVEQISREGDCEKGRLVGIAGHWEDGAALMWETEMKRQGLFPTDDPQWSKLTDSKGNKLYGTQKFLVAGVWLKWKIPNEDDTAQRAADSNEEVNVAMTPKEAAKKLRGVLGGFVSAAGEAAKKHMISAAEEAVKMKEQGKGEGMIRGMIGAAGEAAKKGLLTATEQMPKTERESMEREGNGGIAREVVGILEAAARAAKGQNAPLAEDAGARKEVDTAPPHDKKDLPVPNAEVGRPASPPPIPIPAAADVEDGKDTAAATASPQPGAIDAPTDPAQCERDAVLAALRAALDGGTPCVLPAALLEEWTAGFAAARRLGGGAFGDVYLAQPEGLPRLAVKRLSPCVRLQGAAEDVAAALACVRREVRVLGAFRHPNIIRLLGYTEAAGAAASAAADAGAGRPGELCLAYELAPRGGLDGNLRDAAAAADLTWRVRVRIAAGLARALNFLHCHDPAGPAFHRDVKSANVALTLDLSPKLIDCGLARYAPAGAAGAGVTVLTAGGARLGTPGYKCPAYERTGEYTARSEVFGYGMVLLELLAGRIQGDADSDVYAEFVEGGAELAPGAGLDPRAGAWDPACAAAAAALAMECLAPPARRVRAGLRHDTRACSSTLKRTRAHARAHTRTHTGNVNSRKARRRFFVCGFNSTITQ
jgi:hypothetical protein